MARAGYGTAMKCKSGRCYSPVACKGFGYCREMSEVQSNAEPVAWRYRYSADILEGIDDEWSFTLDKQHAHEREVNAGCIVEPLYTAPPSECIISGTGRP
jgi:hypothetical protein